MEERTKQKVNKMVEKLYYHNNKIKIISEDLRKILQRYFTFEIDVTFCAGDGFLILDVETSDVFSFKCLDELESNILTKDDVRGYGL